MLHRYSSFYKPKFVATLFIASLSTPFFQKYLLTSYLPHDSKTGQSTSQPHTSKLQNLEKETESILSTSLVSKNPNIQSAMTGLNHISNEETMTVVQNHREKEPQMETWTNGEWRNGN